VSPCLFRVAGKLENFETPFYRRSELPVEEILPGPGVKLGPVVSFGEAEGRPFPNLWERPAAKSLTFTRFHLGHADFSSRLWRQSIDAVVGEILVGSLKVPLEQTFPFGEARAMLDRLASRQVASQLILAVNPS
jgi:NADPH2:quinone reductase